MKWIRPAIVLIIVLTGAITFAAYPAIPDLVPSHWNAAGEVDGMMPKMPGLILLPLLMIGFTALFIVLPRIDPLRDNYRKFQDYYDGFILVFAIFLLAIQIQIILWGLGIPVSPNRVFPVLMGLLFIYLGFLLAHAEPSWFVGIRTPWTMSSYPVWKKTHRLGAKLFMLAGAISLVGVLAGTFAFLFIIVPVIAASLITVVYSFLEFRKEQVKEPKRA
ncbi:MAG TPA: SdpI family protein [Methanoregulaceae archaeon]|nr:SdpI family protein [Methanoregulaceae archaeon]HPD76141.1 SdpI family protein [Methanoregulaceae archaeon]HRY75712.1 SdpI family protein [Methanoregulaceae archaeon]